MDIDKLEKIVSLFEKSNVTTLELEVDDMKIKLRKSSKGAGSNVISEVSKLDDVEEVKGVWVKSPLVGTYHTSRGDGVDLVKVGDRVNEGDVLCIIEAMKVMNEITATKDGIVKQIAIEEGAMVQYEEDIILIGDEDV